MAMTTVGLAPGRRAQRESLCGPDRTWDLEIPPVQHGGRDHSMGKGDRPELGFVLTSMVLTPARSSAVLRILSASISALRS